MFPVRPLLRIAHQVGGVALALVVFSAPASCKRDLEPAPRPARVHLSQVPLGSWGEYRLKSPVEDSRVVIAVVARDAKGTVVESTITDAKTESEASAIVELRVYAPKDDFGAPPRAAAVQVAAFEPMSKDPTEPDATIDLSRLSSNNARARETITVPAGTFACLRYRVDLSTGGQADVWISDRALPTGIVKLTWLPGSEAQSPSEQSSSMQLIRLGSGAIPRIKAAPIPFDKDKLTRELISIVPTPPPDTQ